MNQPTYQGRPVTVIRDAAKGDTGFDASKANQVVIKCEDGTEKVVQRSELQQPQGQQQGQQGQTSQQRQPK